MNIEYLMADLGKYKRSHGKRPEAVIQIGEEITARCQITEKTWSDEKVGPWTCDDAFWQEALNLMTRAAEVTGQLHGFTYIQPEEVIARYVVWSWNSTEDDGKNDRPRMKIVSVVTYPPLPERDPETGARIIS